MTISLENTHSASPPTDGYRTQYICPECCGIGTQPTHRWDCPRARRCWADPITRNGRLVLAHRLASASHATYAKCDAMMLPARALLDWRGEPISEGKAGQRFRMMSAECSDLRTDVTERAREATS